MHRSIRKTAIRTYFQSGITLLGASSLMLMETVLFDDEASKGEGKSNSDRIHCFSSRRCPQSLSLSQQPYAVIPDKKQDGRKLLSARARNCGHGEAVIDVILAVDLLNPSHALEQKTHKLKRLVQSPNSYFMDVKCPGCVQITTVFSHAQTVVMCSSCANVLAQPTGGITRLTEGCSFRRKQA
ncbi:40S ribosomal protein S27 [Haplosporangium gracile]|nr:40S ribosomal protein S27 [Haplosporangium gracile]